MAEDTKNFLMNNLEGFVPKPIAQDIIAAVTRGSSILRLSKVQPMESDNKKFPVMVSGPGAYWVGESERITADKAKWIFPEIVAKKIAVIVPVTKEKMRDATIAVFEAIRPYIAEAFYREIDKACIFGTDSPFAKSLYGVAHDAGREIQLGTNTRLDEDVSDVMALVEAAGFDVDGFAASIGFKNSLRKLRDANGNQLYVPGVDQNTLYSKALCIGGEWKYSIVGIRDQIEYTVLQEATLQNVTMEDGKPLSLAEQDMVAIKATMRLGFLPVKEDAFAVLVPKATTTPTTTPTT